MLNNKQEDGAVEKRATIPAEDARLQDFPADYPFQGSKRSVRRQIGNAVPLMLAQVVGESLLDAVRRLDQGAA